MPKPNLFIVGAPKCGTTFLYHYLKKHPDIFKGFSTSIITIKSFKYIIMKHFVIFII